MKKAFRPLSGLLVTNGNELSCLDAELTEYELCEMVNLASINNFIKDEKAEEDENENNYTYDDLLTYADLILEETVNLKDLIFQENDFISCEASTNASSDTSDNTVESSVDMDFDLESLVDIILNELDN
ncbi:1907_t:CDS:2 [Cetraspora pellucida]|uniref:1907_t:CDS:1 n=1 Tax=Cetraspora pellucida TaxID=1433469 RepID=A0A9N9P219_9GLOM|nr:1907_t:CDS:2 [Cetraspora pellucida]